MMKKFITILLSTLLVVTCFGCGKKNETVDTYDKGFFFDYTNSSSTYNSSNWTLESNNGVLDENIKVSNKYTNIIGDNQDVITIMVYMCGADLESEAAMGSYDLVEMANANLSDNVNLIVYTGGCTNWHIEQISNSTNQIYQVYGNGKIGCLVEDAGSNSMTDSNTLVDFLDFCSEHFPANRYDLIMWDHGAGSVSGYGYDERYPYNSSMSLADIDKALTSAKIKFDFIGFDACLMATLENALMLSQHADYLIASEESEPGIGWYYTDWLNQLSKNTSMSTIQIGKNIADSFVFTCSSETPSQPATLSVIDLAEVKETVTDKLSNFSISTSELINNNQYKTVVNARVNSREFASSSNLDLVDLVNLAYNMDSNEGKELAETLLSCIKYNKVSKTMSDSYGLSIYFPYRSSKYVNQVLDTYDDIEMNTDYSNCIRSFVSYQSAGQVASGGSHSPSQSFDGYSTEQYESQSSSDLIFDLIDMFINSSSSNNDPYSTLLDYGINLLLSSMFNRSMSDYIYNNHFDVDLNWQNNKIAINEKQ